MEKQPDLSAEERKAELIAKLEAEHPFFVAAVRKVERADGNDAGANNEKATSVKIIDGLLEKLHVVELTAIPTLDEHPTEELPIPENIMRGGE